MFMYVEIKINDLKIFEIKKYDDNSSQSSNIYLLIYRKHSKLISNNLNTNEN